MAAADTEDRPTVSERLCTASNTSNLSIDLQRRTTADVVLAGNMVRRKTYATRLGVALIALIGEWDACQKPPKRTDGEIAARAMALKDKRGKPDMKRARAEAIAWYAAAMRERYMKLRGRTEVVGLLTQWAQAQDLDADLVSPTVHHFLDEHCPVCSGLKTLRYADAPVLGIRCWHCKGEGKWPAPFGAFPIRSYIAECLRLASGEAGRKLR